jgi:hypothetical protein
MVNTQTIDDAGMHQFKDKSMGVVKHRRVFNPDANQAGNFKNAARRAAWRFPPGHKAPALRSCSARMASRSGDVSSCSPVARV